MRTARDRPFSRRGPATIPLGTAELFKRAAVFTAVALVFSLILMGMDPVGMGTILIAVRVNPPSR